MAPRTLIGRGVTLEPVLPDHVEDLHRILATDAVRALWGDEARSGEEDEPMYRHASIDIFLDPEVHGRGIGRDAVATLARHLVDDRGHHRIVIDPAADNEAAIRCYAAVGFRPVGRMRRYERDPQSGEWHDGLLMDLLAGELQMPG